MVPDLSNLNTLAWVIIGGLTSSLILTFLVPTVYYIFDRLVERIRNRKARTEIVTSAPNFNVEK